MICPNCQNETLRLSPKRKFHDCEVCGYSVLAPGVYEQEMERRRLEESERSYIASMPSIIRALKNFVFARPVELREVPCIYSLTATRSADEPLQPSAGSKVVLVFCSNDCRAAGYNTLDERYPHVRFWRSGTSTTMASGTRCYTCGRAMVVRTIAV